VRGALGHLLHTGWIGEALCAEVHMLMTFASHTDEMAHTLTNLSIVVAHTGGDGSKSKGGRNISIS
jgi:hypothetical protein